MDDDGDEEMRKYYAKNKERFDRIFYSVLGARGGRARAKKLSKKRRSEIARNAANVRWAQPEKGERKR